MGKVEEKLKLPPQTTFAGRLRFARVLRGYTQFDLAMRLPLPITEQTVGRWERAEAEPRESRLAHIAKALAVPLTWLVEGKGTAPQELPE